MSKKPQKPEPTPSPAEIVRADLPPPEPISMDVLALIEGGETLREKLNKRIVLSALTRQPSIPKAARAAGVSPATVLGWLGRMNSQQLAYDAAFARAFEVCYEIGVQTLEMIAQDRALAYSDRLLMFLLRGYRREVFGNAADEDGAVNARAPVNVQVVLHREDKRVIDLPPRESTNGK